MLGQVGGSWGDTAPPGRPAIMGKWILAAGGAAAVAFYVLVSGDSRPPAADRNVCAAAEVAGVDADKYRAVLCDPAQSQAIHKAVSP